MKNKGITLIALVITIIVLLILTGVVIASLTGENGLLNRVGQSAQDNIIGKEKEAIALAWNSLHMENTIDGTPIDAENLEKELTNNGNETTVSYVDDDSNNDFLVTFNDTSHEYIVDKDGNIISQNNKKVEDNIEIVEEYIIEQAELNSQYQIDGWGNDTNDGKPHKDSQWYKEECYKTYAAWGGGKAGMYFEPTIDFDKVTKIEADIILCSNMNGLTNTTTLGVQLDEITKDDIFDVSETIVDKTSVGTEYHVVVDTRNISGKGYIKLYTKHGPESSAMTVAAGVINLKLYQITDKPAFDLEYEQTAENSNKVTISNIKYKDNTRNWKVKYKKNNEENWQTSNSLSIILNDNGIYNIKIISGNIESKVKTVRVGTYIDYKYAQAYNTTSFTNNSTLLSGNYSIGFGGGYEKLNIPIKNCIVGEIYSLKFSMQVPDSQFFNSYSYSYTISEKIDTESRNTVYNNSLEKNSELNEYDIIFKATNNTMYINLSLPDIKNGTYNFSLNLKSLNSTKLPTIDSNSLDFINAQAFNITSFTNSSTLLTGNYLIGFGGGYEKLNIPIKNCIVGETYSLKFSMQVSNSQFYNSYSYSYTISEKIDTENRNTVYNNSLEKNSELNEYDIIFKATNNTMYINLSLPDIKNGTYSFSLNP